jgi:hypothetical protein
MTIRRTALFLPMLLIAACQSAPSGIDPDSIAQPPKSTFRCTGGVALEVENLGSSVNVTSPAGTSVSLPALAGSWSPASRRWNVRADASNRLKSLRHLVRRLFKDLDYLTSLDLAFFLCRSALNQLGIRRIQNSFCRC